MNAANIVGYGLLSPLGNTIDEIFDHLLQGKRALAPVELFATEDYSASQAGELKGYKPIKYLGKKGLRQLDRTGKFAASALGLALQDSGLDDDFRDNHEVSLVLGTNFCSAGTISAFDRSGLELGPEYVSPLDFANTVINAAAGQVAIRYKLRGTNSTTCGGCCAGLKALAYGRELLAHGRERWVLAGGAEELSEVGFAAYAKSPYMGEDGFFLSEGAAFVLLTSEEKDWPNPTHGQVVGHISRTIFSDDTNPLQDAITELLTSNGLHTDDVGLICTSASGYAPTDALEQQALNAVFGESIPRFNPKYWIGEGLGVSGPMQLLLTLEALRRGIAPQTDGSTKTLHTDSKLAVLVGFNPDGLFDLLLIKGNTDE